MMRTNVTFCTSCDNNWRLSTRIYADTAMTKLGFNSLWPSYVIRQDKCSSTLAQVMACCLTAPNRYLNQGSLLINEVLGYLRESNFTASAPTIVLYNVFVNHTFKYIAPFLSGQWVDIIYIYVCIYRISIQNVNHLVSVVMHYDI